MRGSEDAPAVSVVIPFYNRESLLPRAIQSVVEQTYEKWEMVLVDDGSTDGSPHVAEDYCRTNPEKIRLVRQANGGEGSARNTGIDHAVGEFVAFLDSDDRWQPNLLARTVPALAKEAQVDWVYYNARRVLSTGEVRIPSVFDDPATCEGFRRLKVRPAGDLNVIVDEDFLLLAIVGTVKCGANSVVRRSVFDGLAYNPKMRVGVDRLLVMEAIAAGVCFAYLDEVLLEVLEHEGNVSGTDSASEGGPGGQRVLHDLIDVYEHAQKTLPLGKKERVGINHRLASLYFSLGDSVITWGGGREEGYTLMRDGLQRWPTNFHLWKTYLGWHIRSLFSASATPQ